MDLTGQFKKAVCEGIRSIAQGGVALHSIRVSEDFTKIYYWRHSEAIPDSMYGNTIMFFPSAPELGVTVNGADPGDEKVMEVCDLVCKKLGYSSAIKLVELYNQQDPSSNRQYKLVQTSTKKGSGIISNERVVATSNSKEALMMLCSFVITTYGSCEVK